MNKLKLFNKIFLAVVFVLLTGSFISVSKAHAEVMGPNYPSTAVVDTSSGTVGWYFISNIMANDSQMATPDMPPGTTSHIGKVTNFGFSIPAGATINGIVVEFLSYSSADVRVNSIRLVKAGSYTGSTKGLNDTPIQGTSTYGNSSDLWGTTWTAAEVNASNFGVGLQFKNIHGVYQEGINIDYARITVYYTPAPTPTPTLTPTPSTTVPVLASPPSQTGKTDVAITLGGNVTSNGGAALSARGVCYSLTSQDSTPGFTTAGGSTPETNVTCVNEGSTSTGIFTIPQVTGLTPNTPYSFRAFARNSVGNGYSNVGSFTTYGPPTVTTSAASGITNTQASLNSIVNPNGTSTNISYLWGTQAGVDCNLQPNTLAGPIGQTGTSNISPNATTFGGLGSNTTYYYCVMATNTYGTTYGTVLNFDTLTSNPNSYGYMDAGSALGSGATDCQDDPNGAPCAPVNSSGTNGTNPSAAAASTTQINLSWGLNTTGGAVPAVTSYDVYRCGLNQSACGSPSIVNVSNATFSYSNSGISCSTSPPYYYRIVAKNTTNGDTQSNIFSGTTSTCAVAPTVTTPTSSSITSSGATLGANVTSDGGASITSRGTCWGTSPSPTGNCASTSGTTGVFTHARTGMPSNTLIYYRGYAVNSAGTGYSTDGTFTTSKKANGETCSSASECVSNICYVDNDGDRYSPASGTATCRASSQLAGTDCYDGSANAKPGQTSYYTTDRGDGSFDYDCSNGSVERAYGAVEIGAGTCGTSQVYNAGGVPGFCANPTGWYGWCTTNSFGAPQTCGQTFYLMNDSSTYAGSYNATSGSSCNPLVFYSTYTAQACK